MSAGKVFYRCNNNGVVAVVTAETYTEIEAWRDRKRRGAENEPYPGPIFTFVSCDRFERDPGHTGTIELMHQLTAGAHNVFEVFFIVPRSNQELQNMDASELREYFVTKVPTLEDVIAAFGLITPGEVSALVVNGQFVDPFTREVTGDVSEEGQIVIGDSVAGTVSGGHFYPNFVASS